jgi:hypothetical protein
MIRFLFLLSVMFSLSYLAYFFYQVETLRTLSYIFATQTFFMLFILRRPTVKQLWREAIVKKERQDRLAEMDEGESNQMNPWVKRAGLFSAGYAIVTAAHNWNNRDKK